MKTILFLGGAVLFEYLKRITLATGMTISIISNSPCALASESQAEATQGNTSASASSNRLPDGFYFVRRWHYDKDKVGSPAENEALLVNDFHFLEPLEREPIEYVIVQTNPFIPIKLAADPLEDKEDSTGKPRLRIELTEDQKVPLADFTREHIGGLVAIVIGGEIVTKHKIRGAITDGKLQITRCTQHACETLYSTLLKDKPRTPSSK